MNSRHILGVIPGIILVAVLLQQEISEMPAYGVTTRGVGIAKEAPAVISGDNVYITCGLTALMSHQYFPALSINIIHHFTSDR